MPSVDELIAIKERVEAQFLNAPGVTGVDVGYKEVGGQPTDRSRSGSTSRRRPTMSLTISGCPARSRVP